ncbi:TPA: type 2 lanthipeptide synthetase LanM [Staphylococcus aureus]
MLHDLQRCNRTEFSDCKLIYKPKNLKINNSISKIIEYFNHKDKNISIKIPKYINKSEYTYEEFIKQIECKNENELKKFYYHYGQLLGFVYYFNGNDFHLENLIAHKSHPIIVDYETMLQQAVHEYFTIDDEEIVNSLFNRVSRTLLLPTKGSGNNNLNHVEMSALNGKFRKNAFLALQVINEGTDKIKYDYIPLDFNGSNNLPTRDENFDICLYRKEIKKGFQNFSETLLKYKNSKDFKELCKDVLENNKARILLRDTNQYGVIISHMYHPDFLKDMLDREKILENMWGFPYPNKGIIYSEVEQMKKSDIPIFYFNTSEKYIFDDFNNKYEGILKDTSFNYFEKNIENLNMSEVEKQCEIIDVLYPDFYSKIREKNLHNDDNDDNENFKTQIDYEEELFKIANKIIDTSLSKRNPLWLYPENYEGDKWTLKLTDMSFYKGIPGIFLFFNYLCRYSSNSKYKSFYDNLVNNIPDEVIIENHEIGLNSNLGYFYAISLIDDYGKYKLKFVRYIKKVLNEMEKIDLKEIDNYTDYINGALPFINSLIRLYKIGIDRKQTLSLIIKFADHLHYLVGKSDVQSMPTSFGHGIEGVIFTLKNVYRITDIYKYKKTLDYLNDSKEKKSTVEDLTWCNGALGKIINKDEQLEHSNISILDNDCLCHGNLGIVDILAENIMNKQEKDTIDFILRKIISYKNKNGRYKLIDTTYFPDTTLFCGITGIGFTLLKVLSKGKIPSVLKI